MNQAVPSYEQFDDDQSLFYSSNSLWSKKEGINIVYENIYLIKSEKGMKVKSIKFGSKAIIYSKNKMIHLTNIPIRFYNGNQKQIIGMRLQKQDDFIEIFGDIEPILENLKQQTLQLDFSEKYRMQTLIGKGSFSQVYQIISKESGQEMSAKVFDKHKLRREKERQSVINEIHYLRTIKHESIIQLTEVYENNRFLYVITPLFKGGDLKSLVQDRILSEEQCSQIMLKLFKGIYYLHSNQIFHRDIKPQNILFKKKNDISSIHIIDLGLLEEYNESGLYNCTKCGTQGYMAPEILKGENYDVNVDVFSLGLILYFLLTGKKPFTGLSKKEIENKNLVGSVNLNSIACSESCLDFLSHLLEVNPAKRYSAFQSLQHQFLQTGPGQMIQKKIILRNPIPISQPQRTQSFKINLQKLKRLKTLELQDSSISQRSQPLTSSRLSQTKQFSIRKTRIV